MGEIHDERERREGKAGERREGGRRDEGTKEQREGGREGGRNEREDEINGKREGRRGRKGQVNILLVLWHVIIHVEYLEIICLTFPLKRSYFHNNFYCP